MRFIERLQMDADNTVTVDGDTVTAYSVLEDDEGIRWLACPSTDVPQHLAIRAADSCAMLLAPADDRYKAISIEQYSDGQPWGDFDEIPSYFHLDVDAAPAPEKELTPEQVGMVHLHTHSEYSLLDGLPMTDEIVAKVISQDGKYACVSDHGNVAAHPDLQKSCDKAGIKPIFAMEAYLVDDRRKTLDDFPEPEPDKTDPQAVQAYQKRRAAFVKELNDYWHIVLIATSQEGLHNLWAMSTESYRTGMRGKYPRLDWDVLREHSEGVVATTGCLRGPLLHKGLLDGDMDGAIERLGKLMEIFPDRLYVEIHCNQLPQQKVGNQLLVEICKEYKLPLVVAVDSHYVNEGDGRQHKVWTSLQTDKDIEAETTLFAGPQDYWMKTEAEVRESLDYLPEEAVSESIRNTAVIALQCTARMEGEPTPPIFSKGGIDEDNQRLLDLCLSNWHLTKGKRYSQEVCAERFEREFSLIKRKHFSGYFLMTADMTNYAHSRGILVGPGRGCLVGATSVITDRGAVRLDEVRAGDKIITHTGRWEKVTQTHRYECDETLVNIRSYFDDRPGVTLTKDHHVWAEKARRETNKAKIAQGYRWLPATGRMQWLRADEIEVGDLVAMPISQMSTIEPGVVDLADYASPTSRVTDTHIIEQRAVNHEVEFSRRDVHRATGVSRNAIAAAVRGSSRTSKQTTDRIMEYVGQKFDTLDEWVDYLGGNRYDEVAIPRYATIDENFMRLFGMIASNGWTRQDDQAVVGVAVRRSKDDQAVLELVAKVWGLSTSKSDSRTSDLTQYFLRSKAVRSYYMAQMDGYSFNAQTKSIPEWMLRTPSNLRRALLEGLWWGDGSHGSKTTYSTASENLRDSVRLLLVSLGLPAGCRKEVREDHRPDFYGTHTSWTITTTPRFGRMKNQHGWVDNDYVYMRVREINEVEPEPVYDITVPVDHSYCTTSFAVHNSGGGSLVAYLARITDIDAVDADLMFDRFMTEGRTELPDFDIDYPQSRKQEMQEYVRRRFGEENVTVVGSILRLKSKGIIDRMGKVLASQLPEDFKTNAQASLRKIIDDAEADTAGLGIKWDDLNDKFADKLDPYREEFPELFEYCDKLVGRVATFGQHAAGMIVSTDKALGGNLPLRRAKEDGHMISQFDKDVMEQLGFVKFDLLTLRNLDTIQDTIDHIEKNRGYRIDPYSWRQEYEDPQVWDEICESHTLGLFQIETSLGAQYASRLLPRSLADLADLVTVVRPGPRDSGLTDAYLMRKFGEQEVTFPDPRMEPFLQKTYGCLLYQEDIMQCCITLGGYTSTEADKVRKILGKKKIEQVGPAGQEFVARATDRGMRRDDAEHLWEQMAEFARYCVTGDTTIQLASSGRHSDGTMAVEELYRRINTPLLPPTRGKVKKGNEYAGPCVICGTSESPLWIRGACRPCYVWRQKFRDVKRGLYGLTVEADGRIRPARILMVHKHQPEQTWKVTLADGKHITATANHRHLTPGGLRRVDELSVGDHLVVDGGYEVHRYADNEQRTTTGERLLTGAINGAYGDSNYGDVDGGFGSLMAWTAQASETCEECGHDGSEHRLERAHLDGNHANNDWSNLRMLCVSCHKRHDYRFNGRRKRWGKGRLTTSSAIVSIEKAEIEEVYSVVMDDPHIWIANDGIATANSFNRAHAYAYAILAFWSAWLKYHYPVEFLTALLSSVGKDRIPEFVEEARRMGYQVLPPDINVSIRGFKADDLAVRYGLDSLKGIGEGPVDALVAEREAHGPFTSFEDFMARMVTPKGSPMNKGHVATMAHVGVFDSLVPNRRGLETVLQAEKDGSAERCVFRVDTIPVGAPNDLPCEFDWSSEPAPVNPRTGKKLKQKPPPKRCTKACRNYTAPPPPKIDDIEPYQPADIGAIEQETLGVYLTVTPFDQLPDDMRQILYQQAELATSPTGPREIYTVAGIVSKRRPHTDKAGNQMGFIDLKLETGVVSVVCFSRVWEKHSERLKTNSMILAELSREQKGFTLREAELIRG